MSEMNQSNEPRTMSVPHLVMGLIFVGIAGVWLITDAGDTHVHRLGAGIAVVLIGAGVIGLLASLAAARRTKAQRFAAPMYAAAAEAPAAAETSDDPPAEDQTDDTTVDPTQIIDPDGGPR
ncbi:MAG TPA: hypothetical protein VFE15_04250 [Marmoricola sp.]|jgi:hypothetical protein|nr:hypothetical protein [Marmoricola sp.]